MLGDSNHAQACGVCGQPARVRLLEGYHAGEPLFQLLCMRCADAVPEHVPRVRSSTAQRRAWTLAAVAGGLVLAACGLLVEHVHARMSAGEWLIRTLAVLGGAAGIFCGALLNSPTLGLTAAVLFAIAAGAELLGIHGAPGVGWKQLLAVLGGLSLALAGMTRLAARKRATLNRSP
jgi:hypothetical protein